MKKIILLAVVANIFYGCQNIGLPQTGYVSSYGGSQAEATTENQKLEQKTFFLSNTGVSYLLEIISGNLRNNTERKYSAGQNFELYLGETLSLSTGGATLEPIAIPKVSEEAVEYDAYIENGSFYFKSVYAGSFSFVISGLGIPSQTITVKNISPYLVSAFDLNSLVKENVSSNNFIGLKNSVQAFKILFPGNEILKEVSFSLINISNERSDKEIIKEEISYLENNFILDSTDKIKLIQARERVLSNDYNLGLIYLNPEENTVELNEIVKNNIVKRGNYTKEELSFLERYYAKNPSRELANVLGVLYYKAGELQKGSYYSKVQSSGNLPKALEATTTTEESKKEVVEKIGNYSRGLSYYESSSYAEAILFLEKAKSTGENSKDVSYYLGNSYYQTNNYDKAIENFTRVNDVNKYYLESMYKLGDIYFKSGNKEKAKTYFDIVKSKGSSSIWGRRSIIYLNKF